MAKKTHKLNGVAKSGTCIKKTDTDHRTENVLFLVDADERVGQDLVEETQDAEKEPRHDVGRLKLPKKVSSGSRPTTESILL